MGRLVFGSPQANRLLQRDKAVAAYIKEHGVDPDEKLKELREYLRSLRMEKQLTTNSEELEGLRIEIERVMKSLWNIEGELGDYPKRPEWTDRS